jgi:hypothetical protein
MKTKQEKKATVITTPTTMIAVSKLFAKVFCASSEVGPKVGENDGYFEC